jgi:hypothetical protein
VYLCRVSLSKVLQCFIVILGIIRLGVIMLSAIMVNVLAPKAAAVKVGFLIPAVTAFTKLSLLVIYDLSW